MTAYQLASEALDLQNSSYDIFAEFVRRGWTDGLPIVPPTEELVERFIAAVKGSPDTIVAPELPPRRAIVTLEKVAINAVMAGCLPEYMPIVVTMVECITEPQFNIYGINTTTGPVCVATMVNGPLAREIDLNGSYGFLGPGWRSNATIGRAIALIQRNIGGRIPGSVSKSTQGQPGRYTLCFRELEERSPWAPFHTTRGFKPEENAVTCYGANSTSSMIDTSSKSAANLANTIAKSIDSLGTNTMRMGGSSRGETMIVICPDHATLLNQGGFTREKLQEYLVRHARRPLSDWHEEDQIQTRRSQDSTVRVDEGWAYLHGRPDQFLLAVAGGAGGYHSVCLSGWTPTSTLSVTKRVRMSYS